MAEMMENTMMILVMMVERLLMIPMTLATVMI
jgi:hypothetical protein